MVLKISLIIYTGTFVFFLQETLWIAKRIKKKKNYNYNYNKNQKHMQYYVIAVYSEKLLKISFIIIIKKVIIFHTFQEQL